MRPLFRAEIFLRGEELAQVVGREHVGDQDRLDLVPDLDRDRAEYAVADVLLEEAWVGSR